MRKSQSCQIDNSIRRITMTQALVFFACICMQRGLMHQYCKPNHIKLNAVLRSVSWAHQQCTWWRPVTAQLGPQTEYTQEALWHSVAHHPCLVEEGSGSSSFNCSAVENYLWCVPFIWIFVLAVTVEVTVSSDEHSLQQGLHFYKIMWKVYIREQFVLVKELP